MIKISISSAKKKRTNEYLKSKDIS